MPACISRSPGRYRRAANAWAGAVLALGAATWTAEGLAEGLKVTAVQSRVTGDRLTLTGTLDIGLTSKVEEALNNGIPLEFVFEARLHRRRALIWDETTRSWMWRRELRYHALSGQYLLTSSADQDRARQSFQTLAEALIQAGNLAESLPLATPLASDGDYRVGVRVHLDIEALPPVLRPVAYTSRAWDLNSGWTMWKLEH